MRVLTVLGARPQFIKAAVVSSALKDAGVEEVLVHTGQHHDARMSEVFFDELGLLPPRHHLGIAGLSHGAMTGRMLEEVEKVVVSERPEYVLVYGDTNSTLAAALAAAKLHVPVAHVEAGMRSFNRRMPEEINRVLCDHVAELLFLTSEAPEALLAREGITEGVHVVGDVMYDAKLLFAEAASRTGVRRAIRGDSSPYGLVTLHRQENTDDLERLDGILEGLRRVSRELPLVFPVHPRLAKTLATTGRTLVEDGIHCIEPVGYLAMQDLEAGASLVLTDSGGVQKEAFFHSVPCVTFRDETEWTETVALGWNRLVGADPNRLFEASVEAIASPPEGSSPPVYGDGDARIRIAAILANASPSN